MESEPFKKIQNYWLERFSGEVPLLNLPTDFPRPDLQSFSGEWIPFTMEPQLQEKLIKLGKDADATLYMVLLAALTILLNKYTGQEDITIASPIMGRDHEELENIIGLFINLLPMRNFPEPHKTFSGFLKEVKENALSAYENQAHPFGNLVEKLRIQKDYTRNPLDEVELIVVNTDFSNLDIPGLRLTPYEYNQDTTMADIILEVTELPGQFSFKLMYCTRLFKRATMEKFIDSFKEILARVNENQDILLKDISLSTQLEKAVPVFKVNEGNFDF